MLEVKKVVRSVWKSTRSISARTPPPYPCARAGAGRRGERDRGEMDGTRGVGGMIRDGGGVGGMIRHWHLPQLPVTHGVKINRQL